jgi:hypothetical protein
MPLDATYFRAVRYFKALDAAPSPPPYLIPPPCGKVLGRFTRILRAGCKALCLHTYVNIYSDTQLPRSSALNSHSPSLARHTLRINYRSIAETAAQYTTPNLNKYPWCEVFSICFRMFLDPNKMQEAKDAKLRKNASSSDALEVSTPTAMLRC